MLLVRFGSESDILKHKCPRVALDIFHISSVAFWFFRISLRDLINKDILPQGLIIDPLVLDDLKLSNISGSRLNSKSQKQGAPAMLTVQRSDDAWVSGRRWRHLKSPELSRNTKNASHLQNYPRLRA